MYETLGINKELLDKLDIAETELTNIFKKIDNDCFINSSKVMKAFQENRVSEIHFGSTTGYGYNDIGRDTIEKVFANILGADDALVRSQFISGSHALTVALFAYLRPNDIMLSITGTPYDTLHEVIGIKENKSSLKSFGIKYEQIDLVNDDFDIEKIVNRLQQSKVKMVEIQRSRGYSDRLSLSIYKIEKVCKKIREVDKDVIIMVDNCYGDFVETREPIEVGADVLVGSLMKNLGAGQAKTGGYVVGKAEYVHDIAERFSAPCVAKDIGANLNQLLSFYKGIYHAPSVVCSCLKTMALASYLLEKLGYTVSPRYNDFRTDIVQTVQLHSANELIEFCRGIQKGVALENFVTLMPSEMPGYPHQEIMASGSFINGSTIELSCDGPITPPYTAYMQGSLTYEYGKLGILISLTHLQNQK